MLSLCDVHLSSWMSVHGLPPFFHFCSFFLAFLDVLYHLIFRFWSKWQILVNIFSANQNQCSGSTMHIFSLPTLYPAVGEARRDTMLPSILVCLLCAGFSPRSAESCFPKLEELNRSRWGTQAVQQGHKSKMLGRAQLTSGLGRYMILVYLSVQSHFHDFEFLLFAAFYNSISNGWTSRPLFFARCEGMLLNLFRSINEIIATSYIVGVRIIHWDINLFSALPWALVSLTASIVIKQNKCCLWEWSLPRK